MTVKKRGFGLTEIMLVVAIISLLSSVVMTNLNKARVASRDARRIADLRQINLGIGLYFEVHGHYPDPASYPSNAGRYWVCSSGTEMQAAWAAFAAELAPYVKISQDPVNTGDGMSTGPWTNGFYSYCYWTDLNSIHLRYNLVGQFENRNSPYRCGVKSWTDYQLIPPDSCAIANSLYSFDAAQLEQSNLQ